MAAQPPAPLLSPPVLCWFLLPWQFLWNCLQRRENGFFLPISGSTSLNFCSPPAPFASRNVEAWRLPRGFPPLVIQECNGLPLSPSGRCSSRFRGRAEGQRTGLLLLSSYSVCGTREMVCCLLPCSLLLTRFAIWGQFLSQWRCF